MRPANDNVKINPAIIEVKRPSGWHLLVRVDGRECFMTPDFADHIASGLEGAPKSEPVIHALQYAAYRCRMFDGGLCA